MSIAKHFAGLILWITLGTVWLAFPVDIRGVETPILTDTDFETASKQNARLKFSLKWVFGRRTQRGWYLYTALIQNTLGTGKKVDSIEFAKAVYEWQRNRRLRATGVVNRATLGLFIKYWQSRRLKPIVLARDYQLRSGPIADFFDPTREPDLLKLEKRTYLAYKKMVAAAIADKSLLLKVDRRGNLAEDEKFLKIVSSYRSPEYQASLRKKEPNASRAQLAYRSPHFSGRALDIYVGGEPVTTKDFNRAIQVKTPVYLWLVKNAEKYGFYPYFYEPWHWEYVGPGGQ
jgi:hypothetical protein